MEHITLEQLEKLAKEKTLVTGFTSCSWDPHHGKIVVGIFYKEKDEENSIRYAFQYRIVKEGARNPVQGHKFETVFAYFDGSTGRVDQSELKYWILESVQAKTLSDAWDAAEDRYNNRQKFVGNTKAPFENVISEVKENIVSLVPEIPLDGQDKFLTQTKIVMSKRCISFTYNVYTSVVQWIDLDSLVSVENFVKKVAKKNKLTFRASRLGINRKGLLHEFFFN